MGERASPARDELPGRVQAIEASGPHRRAGPQIASSKRACPRVRLQVDGPFTAPTWAAGETRRRVRIDPRTAAGLRPLPTRLLSSWMGLAHRPSWCHHCQVRGAVVLTGRAISVPFQARHHRSATVNHGHSRSTDLQAPNYRLPEDLPARFVCFESVGPPAAATVRSAYRDTGAELARSGGGVRPVQPRGRPDKRDPG